MLLSNLNSNQKYKITGYDIVPELINKIPTLLYDISSDTEEDFLCNDVYLKTNGQRFLRDLFDKHFERIPKKWQQSEFRPRDIENITRKLNISINPDEQRELSYLLSYIALPIQSKWNDYFVPKSHAFDGFVRFQTADISELGSGYNLKDTGVILFKNAFYHITGYSAEKAITDLTEASNVAKAVNRSLPKNGLFVIGALENDHMYTGQDSHEIKQNGITIRVFDSSAFHKMLRENGFEPVFYDQLRDGIGNKIPWEVYLPSVWKKTKDV